MSALYGELYNGECREDELTVTRGDLLDLDAECTRLRARVAELERIEANLREELRQVYVVARAIGEKSRDGSIPRFWEGAS